MYSEVLGSGHHSMWANQGKKRNQVPLWMVVEMRMGRQKAACTKAVIILQQSKPSKASDRKKNDALTM